MIMYKSELGRYAGNAVDNALLDAYKTTGQSTYLDLMRQGFANIGDEHHRAEIVEQFEASLDEIEIGNALARKIGNP